MELKDNLDKIRQLMYNDLDLALQLIKGQGWDLKEVLIKLYESCKISNNRSHIIYHRFNFNVISVHLYKDHSSVWYGNINAKCETFDKAINIIIEQLIKDNRWNT